MNQQQAHTIDDAHSTLMNTKIWCISQVYPFGMVLKAALIDAGYEVELVLDGRLHVVLLEVEGVKVEVYWHCLAYAYTTTAACHGACRAGGMLRITEYRDPFYYIVALYQGARASHEARGIVNLLEIIPTIVGKLRTAVQCNGCHYSNGTYCGTGLVATGECSQYKEATA